MIYYLQWWLCHNGGTALSSRQRRQGIGQLMSNSLLQIPLQPFQQPILGVFKRWHVVQAIDPRGIQSFNFAIQLDGPVKVATQKGFANLVQKHGDRGSVQKTKFSIFKGIIAKELRDASLFKGRIVIVEGHAVALENDGEAFSNGAQMGRQNAKDHVGASLIHSPIAFGGDAGW